MVPAGLERPRRPIPLVKLAWGSASTRSTLRSARAREAARLMTVVVLPTPPFWLAMAIILPIYSDLQEQSYHGAVLARAAWLFDLFCSLFWVGAVRAARRRRFQP